MNTDRPARIVLWSCHPARSPALTTASLGAALGPLQEVHPGKHLPHQAFLGAGCGRQSPRCPLPGAWHSAGVFPHSVVTARYRAQVQADPSPRSPWPSTDLRARTMAPGQGNFSPCVPLGPASPPSWPLPTVARVTSLYLWRLQLPLYSLTSSEVLLLWPGQAGWGHPHGPVGSLAPALAGLLCHCHLSFWQSPRAAAPTWQAGAGEGPRPPCLLGWAPVSSARTLCGERTFTE